MRLIHCADLHLDSAMTGHLDPQQARSRRAELLHTFLRMIDYAEDHRVDAILIAGDLFDTHSIPAGTRKAVLSGIRNHSDILFFYLRGNHDDGDLLSDSHGVPENLKTFTDHWKAYRMNSIVIRGLECTPENSASLYNDLQPSPDTFNIVMLHGQISQTMTRDPLSICLPVLQDRRIDYLALGHVHAYQSGSLDRRGIYCYPGCLEGRGYDECGPHGFVLLDIDESTGTFSHTFVPFASRTLYCLDLDVTGLESTPELLAEADRLVRESGCRPEDLVKFVLIGDLDVEADIHPELVNIHFRDSFYHVRVKDQTRIHLDPRRYLQEESLKGEFVRTILGDSTIEDEDKAAIIRYGLQAIAGEEFHS